MAFLNFSEWSLWINVAIFLVSGGCVWAAGSRLAGYIDGISDQAKIGKGFAGMLLLGGITSLPEIATTTTASFTGNAPLAINNLLGTSSINLVLLAIADAIFGRSALTSVAANPGSLLQGVLGMILMGVVTVAIIAGEVALGPVGAWSSLLIILCIGALWLSSRYDRRHVWEAVDGKVEDGASRTRSSESNKQAGGKEEDKPSLRSLVIRTVIAAAIILVSGFLLSQSADAISQKTGIGASLVGLVLVGLATSLPELSSIVAAVRIRRYEMAVGDIFGTNLFNISLLFLTDLTYSGDPALEIADTFEAVAAVLALILTGIFVLGLLERRDRTIFRLGYDAAAVLAIFGAGLGLLYTLTDQSATAKQGQQASQSAREPDSGKTEPAAPP
ncbi:sodium:calcium antiporter [Microvirga lenta]|uniref:sodium:calcium antiporter n=1 Tax=Microvirga lenta TaxID=2881337 RepID=UPI001CFF948D|nr:sodium:calcium antiporter [Microvirga lenta]MCB5175550.1 sodium:calcium antiporter [Microvirga lenta]